MVRIISYFLFIFFVLNLYSASEAGFFDNLKKDILKGIPAPGGANPNQQDQSNNKSDTVEPGKLNYRSSSIIKFLCQKTPPPGLPTDPSPNEKLVAEDFGKSVEDTKKIIRDNFQKPTGPVWAQSIPYYRDAFNPGSDSDPKILFDMFIGSKGSNVDVLSQLKQIADKQDSYSTVENTEINEARFAYGIILSHYQEFHGKKTYAADLLDAAYQGDQIGAVYVIGKRYFYGWDVERNVNKAANILQPLSSLSYNRGIELWHKVAVDPDYKYRNMGASMAKQAALIKARLEKEIKKKTGSALRKRIDRLNNLRITALRKLGDAFGVAEKLGAKLAGLQDIKNQADPSQQVVEKNTKIGDAATKFINSTMANSTKELDPKGKKLVQEAFEMNRSVLAQLGATTVQFMSSPGATSSLLSDMAAMAPAMDKGMKASCKLDSGLVVYAEKKNFKMATGKSIEVESDDLKVVIEDGAAK